MHPVRAQHSPLQDALTDESLRRKTESHRLQYGQTLVDGVVSKIHSTFLLDRQVLESLKLYGDYGACVSLPAAQPIPGIDRADVTGIDLCLIKRGVSIRLGAKLYPVDLQLLANAPTDDSPGGLSIEYKRSGLPRPNGDVQATYALDADIDLVLRDFYSRLVKHVQLP